jgi:hypothetical protein
MTHTSTHLKSGVMGVSSPPKNTTDFVGYLGETVKVDSKTSYEDFYVRPRNHPRLTPIDMSKAFPHTLFKDPNEKTPNEKRL